MTFTIRASHDDVADLAARLNDYIYNWNKFEYADWFYPVSFDDIQKAEDELFFDMIVYKPFTLISILTSFVRFASEEKVRDDFSDFIYDITDLYDDD